MRLFIISSLVWLATFASADNFSKRDGCANGYTLCSPAGATTTITPQIGDGGFQNLFVDIVHSSLPASKRSLSTRDSASLCCIATLDCLTMNTLSLPFCYDRFTTNYFLPDGSFGTVVGGAYTSATKDTANLETGDYTLSNGTTGNLYSSNEAAKPTIATLPLPSQFTGSGIGTVIPASALGDEITLTFTSTLSATTVPATTIAESTLTSSEIVIFASVETSTVSTRLSNAGVPVTASPTPISTIETTIVIPATTLDATTIQASVSVVTTTIDTLSNPAIFGTNGMTATGVTPTASSVTKKSAGSSHRAPSVSAWLMLGICGLAGLTL